MSDKEAEILIGLFGPQAQKKQVQHRVYSYHFNPETKAGQRTHNAAKNLEGTGLVRISGGSQQNIYQIFVRE